MRSLAYTNTFVSFFWHRVSEYSLIFVCLFKRLCLLSALLWRENARRVGQSTTRHVLLVFGVVNRQYAPEDLEGKTSAPFSSTWYLR